jgi:alkylation response protein AidB-like acyl-CoA dehydrogenase
MEFAFSAEEASFRKQARAWLEANRPSEPRPDDGMPMREFDLAWQKRKYEGGWAGIAWPREYGGLGLSLVQQMIWYEECARAGAPLEGCLSVALNHAGPTIIALGTDAQKAKYLPPILKGEVVWCQGFSEPEAGSDLAGLRLRGVRDGERLKLNGQKIWTSHAHVADYQETLIRTGEGSTRHKGLTWCVVDMKAPGLTIRPIPTLAHNHHFCEVFYEDTPVPLADVVGAVDDGWRVAMATLSFERGGLSAGRAAELRYLLERLIRLARERPGPDGRGLAIEDAEIVSRLATLRAEVAALQAMVYETASRDLRGEAVGSRTSVDYLYCGEVLQRIRALSLDVLGPEALEAGGEAGAWTLPYLGDRYYLIAGGTAEVRRNIIAERVLGLPRSY